MKNSIDREYLSNLFNRIYKITRSSTTNQKGGAYNELAGFSKNNALKLHIGCGPRILKGWVNIDLKYEPYHNYMKYYTDKYYPKEIRGDKSDFFAIDVTKFGIPLPDNSVDVIFHEDFIEHLNQRDQITFLAETLRVLKKDCVHRVNTPDLLWSMHNHSDFSKGFNGVYTDEWNKHNHFNVLTPSILQELSLLVGYKEVIFNGRNQSKSKRIPLEYRPDPNNRPNVGNIFADLIK
ncbi:MAG: methyltransferase domain-containing protein [Methanolobus sp.]|uniref:class I SAM-dependent methyltransferase n=1 Tax=Methanolobus sp. TaxID=1874737 RepID=UPI00272FB74E|nr:methyltransferase domain-containing protein [Methanolobus sp.]MDP2217468.1 methyltransferase domain-containing protein [Methanolobus sp.]